MGTNKQFETNEKIPIAYRCVQTVRLVSSVLSVANQNVGVCFRTGGPNQGVPISNGTILVLFLVAFLV